MRIDLVFDTICPWCYIGKRRLERALEMRPGLRVELRWRPFLLNPEMPPGGLDRRLYLEAKFGSPHRVTRVYGAAAAAGQSEGIDFQFGRIERTPNSVASHRLIRFAEAHGREADAVEALFSAYFVEGRDIGNRAELVAIGRSIDLPEEALGEYLASDTDIGAVNNDNARAHRAGISGVPAFVFDEAFAVAGAQEPAILARLIDLAREAQVDPALS